MLLREIAFAYAVLLASLFIGGMALRVLGLRHMVAVQMFMDGVKAFLAG